MYPIRYWVHHESDTVFKTKSRKEEKQIEKDVELGLVMEIDYDKYNELKENGYSAD